MLLTHDAVFGIFYCIMLPGEEICTTVVLYFEVVVYSSATKSEEVDPAVCFDLSFAWW